MCMLPKAKKDARATGGGPSNVRLDRENELVLSAAEEASTADCEPKPEPNEEDTEVDFMFEDGLMENQSISATEQGKEPLEMSNLEVQEQDPFLEANREVESQDSVTTPDEEEEEEIDDEKFIRRVRKKIAVQELEKMEAENFTAQLRRNMAIAKYNKVLGKNIPLRPLPDMGL